MSGREAILSRIRKSLAVDENDPTRQSRVKERLFSAPVGIIPQRGQLEKAKKMQVIYRKSRERPNHC